MTSVALPNEAMCWYGVSTSVDVQYLDQTSQRTQDQAVPRQYPHPTPFCGAERGALTGVVWLATRARLRRQPSVGVARQGGQGQACATV